MINIRFYMRSEIVFRDLPMSGQDEHLEIYDMAVAVWMGRFFSISDLSPRLCNGVTGWTTVAGC